jgi:hypothetical protein
VDNQFIPHWPSGRVKKKPWVGLTDEEMFEALKSVDADTIRLPIRFKQFIQAAEAKLREKNSG